MSLGMRTGRDFTGVSDTEVLDAIGYFIFPNLAPWGGYAYPFVTRYRRTGTTPTPACSRS